MSDERAGRFRWLERGEGEPVLFLHGLMGAHGSLGGHPRSPRRQRVPPHGAGSAHLRALVARGLHRGARRPRARLPGRARSCPAWSWAATRSAATSRLRVALAAPERVSGLVLTGSSGLFERGFTRGVPHRPSADFVREKMEEIFHDPTLRDPGVGRVGPADRHHAGLGAARAAVRPRRASGQCRGRLAEVRPPTLLVWGREDRITPPEVAERFRRLIPDAELLYISVLRPRADAGVAGPVRGGGGAGGCAPRGSAGRRPRWRRGPAR